MASLRIGSLFGIPIKLGLSFLLVLPLIAYLIGSEVTSTVEFLNLAFDRGIDPDVLTEGVLPWLLGSGAALGLFGSVLLHELGHSLVARRYGVEIESITLWFLGGLAQFAEVPDDWRQELAIATAGPIVSVALGFAFYGAFLLVPSDLASALFIVGYLAVLNVVLAAFNMLPGFPMDGGRVLRALLSRNRSRLSATRTAASVGKGFAFLLGMAGVLALNPFWIVLAFFIFIAATSETRHVVMEAAFQGLTVEEIMTPRSELDTVTPETTVEQLLDRMVRERHTGYPVVDGDRVLGIVTLEDVQKCDPKRRALTTVGDIMSNDLVTVTPTTEAGKALTTIQQEGIGRVLVMNPDETLAGLISRTDLMTVFEISQTSQAGEVRPRSVRQ